MNKERRKQLNEIAEQIGSLKDQLESLRDEEQDYYDNMPESFQGGEKGERARTAIDSMDSALDRDGGNRRRRWRLRWLD